MLNPKIKNVNTGSHKIKNKFSDDARVYRFFIKD